MSCSFQPVPRRQRVDAAYAWEVAKRTTERDRELAYFLYRHKLLTTGQLERHSSGESPLSAPADNHLHRTPQGFPCSAGGSQPAG